MSDFFSRARQKILSDPGKYVRNTLVEGEKILNQRLKQGPTTRAAIPAKAPNPRPMLLNIPPQNDMVQQLGIKAAPSTKDVKAKQQEKKLAQQQKKEKEEFQTLILNQGKPLTKDQKDFNEVIGAK